MKALLILIMFLVTSCATNYQLANRYNTIETNLVDSKYHEALSHLKQNGKQYADNDRVLYLLDLAILEHYTDDYKNSIAHFEEAEKLMEKLYTESLSKTALSMIGNDNVLDYAGEDHENIYINVFKAINFIELNQEESALIEIRRIHEKLKLLSVRYAKEIDKLKAKHAKKDSVITFGEFNFNDSAVARLLSLLLYRADLSFDDAAIDKRKLEEIWNDYTSIYDSKRPQFDKIRTDLPNDSAIVDVMAFIGHGPEKFAWELDVVTTKKNTVVRGQNPDFFEVFPLELDPDLSFKVSLPKVKIRQSRIRTAKIYVNGTLQDELELIENIGNVAFNTFKMKETSILIKSLIRSALKSVASAKTSNKIRKEVANEHVADFLSFVTKAAINSTENADLRSWRLMPGNCYFSEFALPFGTHTIKIEYIDTRGNILKTDQKEMTLTKSKKLNMVNSYAF